jgi:hypothetical protein
MVVLAFIPYTKVQLFHTLNLIAYIFQGAHRAIGGQTLKNMGQSAGDSHGLFGQSL